MYKTIVKHAPSRSSLQPIRNNLEIVPYTPIQKNSKYDLRLIKVHKVAVTKYERRDEGFERLGTYMAAWRCRETQPVVMTYHPDGTKTMQVYLVPREAEADGEAETNDGSGGGVWLDAAGGELIAAARFEGNATKEACYSVRDSLVAALKSDGLTVASEDTFRLAQYGPLFSLGPRLNEIWMTIAV